MKVGLVKLAFRYIIIISFAIIVSLLIVKSGFSSPSREVSSTIEVTGIVNGVIINPYDINLKLKILSTNSSRLNLGDEILVRVAGVGSLDQWRSKSLKVNDVIGIYIRFVENAFWEAYDDDWNFIQ